MSDELIEIEDRLCDLEFQRLKKQQRIPARQKMCGGECRPTPCYKNGRQLVMSLTSTGKYDSQELHFPCGSPGCNAKALCEAEKRERQRRGVNW